MTIHRRITAALLILVFILLGIIAVPSPGYITMVIGQTQIDIDNLWIAGIALAIAHYSINQIIAFIRWIIGLPGNWQQRRNIQRLTRHIHWQNDLISAIILNDWKKASQTCLQLNRNDTPKPLYTLIHYLANHHIAPSNDYEQLHQSHPTFAPSNDELATWILATLHWDHGKHALATNTMEHYLQQHNSNTITELLITKRMELEQWDEAHNLLHQSYIPKAHKNKLHETAFHTELAATESNAHILRIVHANPAIPLNPEEMQRYLNALVNENQWDKLETYLLQHKIVDKTPINQPIAHALRAALTHHGLGRAMLQKLKALAPSCASSAALVAGDAMLNANWQHAIDYLEPHNVLRTATP